MVTSHVIYLLLLVSENNYSGVSKVVLFLRLAVVVMKNLVQILKWR